MTAHTPVVRLKSMLRRLTENRMLLVVVTSYEAPVYHLVRREADIAATIAPMIESHFHRVCKPRFLLAEPHAQSCG